MTAHLTEPELRAFATGVLAPEALLRADDHLSQCDQCRTLAANAGQATQRLSDFRAQLNDATTPHVSEEDLVRFVTHQLPADTRETVASHLIDCATCASQVDDLRQWTEAAAQSRTNRWRLAAAAAVLIGVLVPSAIWQFRAQRPASTPSSVAGIDTLAPADRTRVHSVIDAGVVSLPAFIGDIAASREVLMGSNATGGDTFDLAAPVATGILTDRPVFRWQRLAGAEAYVVSLFDERSNVVARSPRLTGTEWTPVDPLERDRTYVWQVAADRRGDTITAPAPPAPPARFHVVDAHTADVLERMDREHAQSHVLLGILYMESGVVDAAAVHFRQVPASDVHATLAREALEKLAPYVR